MSGTIEVLRAGKYGMPASKNEVKHDLQPILDQLILAHRRGHRTKASAFAKCAEALLCSAYPRAAAAISSAASRKGKGSILSSQIVPHMDVIGAAAVVIVLMLRGARQPVVRAISDAFAHDEDFRNVQRTLCRRMFEP